MSRRYRTRRRARLAPLEAGPAATEYPQAPGCACCRALARGLETEQDVVEQQHATLEDHARLRTLRHEELLPADWPTLGHARHVAAAWLRGWTAGMRSLSRRRRLDRNEIARLEHLLTRVRPS